MTTQESTMFKVNKAAMIYKKKKKLIEYSLRIKDRFFTLKGLLILFIMCTISYISELAGYTLKVFLMKSYSIPEDSYTMDLFLILCRFPFIIIQMMIIYEIYQFTKKKDKSDIYEFTKKIDKSDIYKYTTLNTAYFYLNDSNKSKVSKAE